MPFVRIDLSKKHPEGFAQQVGEIVYQVMTTHINVPKDDKFQVITKHESQELIVPKSYLGIEYSEDIIFIQVTLNEGRTTELKKKFYKAICEGLVERLKVRPQDIVINLIEVNKENWSFGNGEMQYAPKD
ncbi:tautomerase family protein [Polynucleobacter sp. AP-Sanab-80-C2]|jgi:phenylpyruvate tautomerase PptA (4-oxalocrotonate tautomerase family)|uniref:tautomerase family protein n=1 Tax=Polynucleobacter sp. AP-Sanab-80-C2 TaxID=3108274 RepID=UPI002B235A39|nr:tautomerase family protein [Polynucleobacter sp. AP-Sanab-80-C2]MEA9599937.1 tautomerase family protein [Polynucleobacter sp. AP-Sanab-80-C2]